MTIRRKPPVPRSLDGIARQIPPWLVHDHRVIESPEEFRMWWEALAEAVESVTGTRDQGLVMSVAIKLDIDPAEWFRQELPDNAGAVETPRP